VSYASEVRLHSQGNLRAINGDARSSNYLGSQDECAGGKHPTKTQNKDMRWSGKSVCGVCGKRITDPRKNNKGNTGMWLCKKCKPPLRPWDRCEWCQWLPYCKTRVRVGLWLLCERPIVDDILRMQMLEVDDKDYRP